MPKAPRAVDASRVSATDLAVLSLASFRLWRLLALDDFPPIEWRRKAFLEAVGDKSVLAEALRCPWCSGAWLAAGMSLAALRWPRFRRALVPLAVSALVGMLSTLDSTLGRVPQPGSDRSVGHRPPGGSPVTVETNGHSENLGDWTLDPNTGRSNASQAFERTVEVISDLLRESSHFLIAGDTKRVARLIVAQLAHRYGFVPIHAEIMYADESLPRG